MPTLKQIRSMPEYRALKVKGKAKLKKADLMKLLNVAEPEPKEDTPECPICAETYTAKVRRPVECAKCNKCACTDCVKQYLLSKRVDAHCMHCKHPWNQEFIDANLTRAFRTGPLRKHRQEILLSREKSYLPAAQAALEIKLEKKKHLDALYTLAQQLREQLRNVEQEIQCVQYNKQKTERKKFVRKCPAEDCRGFLSTAWKCGMCERYTCKDCLQLKEEHDGQGTGEGHVCDPGNVEMAQMLAKDSKPCPKCGEMAQKLGGCNQMWCLWCNTAWDWATGQIENGRVHNPHYYEWLQRTGGQRREPGDVPCGGLPTYRHFWDGNTRECYRLIEHLRVVTLPELRVPVGPEQNQDLHFKYLQNRITEDKWKSTLTTRENRNLVKQELYELYDMFATVAEESFRKMQTSSYNFIYVTELLPLREYVNQQAASISKRYKVRVIVIEEGHRTRQWLLHEKTIWQLTKKKF